MSTTIDPRQVLLAIPVIVLGWIALLAGVMRLGGPAPAALVPLPPPGLLAALPPEVTNSARGRWSVTVQGGDGPGLVAALFCCRRAAGAARRRIFGVAEVFTWAGPGRSLAAAMTHPYQSLDQRQFWAPAVGQRDAMQIADLWRPRFAISAADRIVTFGSCFAQHIGRALVARGYGWTDHEPAPKLLTKDEAAAFNFGTFSARTGNIYTARMLRHWVTWALGDAEVPDEVWERDGRFHDPFRPTIEPRGFADPAEVHAARQVTLERIRAALTHTDLFIFTLGLTESWRNRQETCEYALCPGVVAVICNPADHAFHNASYSEILSDLTTALTRLRSVNPGVRVVLTVSPVPLTATASGQHVLVATTRSKSVLRAVASALECDWVDYFPAYEIICAPPFGGRFFDATRRSVTPDGVAHVMAQFFAALEGGGMTAAAHIPESADDQVCEEQILAAFAPKG